MYSKSETARKLAKQLEILYESLQMSHSVLSVEYTQMFTDFTEIIGQLYEDEWRNHPDFLKRYLSVINSALDIVTKLDSSTIKDIFIEDATNEIARINDVIMPKAIRIESVRRQREKEELANALLKEKKEEQKATIIKEEQEKFIKNYAHFFDIFPRFSFAEKYLDDFNFTKDAFNRCKTKFSNAQKELAITWIRNLFKWIEKEDYTSKDHELFKRIKHIRDLKVSFKKYE